MNDFQIVDAMKESGTITEQEATDWLSLADKNMWVSGGPDAGANYQKVNDLIETFNDPPSAPPASVGDAAYPTDDPLAASTKDLPIALNTTGEPGGDVSVSTAALTTFAGNLKKLGDLVDEQYSSISGVSIAPGTFGAGVHIKDTIGNLRVDTLNFLQSVSSTFTSLITDIGNLKLEYDSTEEWNEMSVQGLNNAFNDAFGDIGNYSEYGNASTENLGGDNSGTSNSGNSNSGNSNSGNSNSGNSNNGN